MNNITEYLRFLKYKRGLYFYLTIKYVTKK